MPGWKLGGMLTDQSVTHWIGELKAGNEHALEPLWQRYFHRLVGLASHRLAELPRLPADGEDVALSAFNSFYQGLKRGHFPVLDDRDNLWRVLVTLTARKAARVVRDERTDKRGGGLVVGESGVALPGMPAWQGFEQLISSEPTPEFAAMVGDECRRLLQQLPDEEQRNVALLKMEGYTSEEISQRIGRSLATIERKLKVIRTVWESCS